jgi:catechol 2,3-dioxygenase
MRPELRVNRKRLTQGRKDANDEVSPLMQSSDAKSRRLALVENPNLPPAPAEWRMWDMPMAINHIAIAYPSREDWLSQLDYLQEKGVKFDRRIDHGMTHSLYLHDPNGYGVELAYELPREVWEGDIDAALNFAELRPHDGPEALIDRTDVPTFGEQSRLPQ